MKTTFNAFAKTETTPKTEPQSSRWFRRIVTGGFQVRTVIATVLVVTLCAATSSERKWTNSAGKFVIEAEFLDFQDGKVRLKKADGSVVVIPMEGLSKADQAWVKDRVKFDTARPKRNWWVIDVILENGLGGRKGSFLARLLVVSLDKGFIETLSGDKWEVQSGPKCELFKNPMPFGVEADNKIAVPNTTLKIFGVCHSEDIHDFLETSIRVKGEKDWLRLSDFIQVEPGGEKFRIVRCSRCLTLLKPSCTACPNCNAQLMPAKKN